MKHLMSLLIAPALLASGIAIAATPPAAPGQDASIPFVDSGSVSNWSADGTRGIYVQDLHNRWYHADLVGPCSDLPYANAVGFETRGPDTLDKFGAVIVRGQRCTFSNFVTSDGPPIKVKQADHKG